MALIHKQPVHPKLLKRDNVVFSRIVVQLFQPCFQRLPRLFHLLDTVILPISRLHFPDGLLYFLYLASDKHYLPLHRQRDFLKLAVPYNHRIKVAHGYPGTELFPVGRLKIPLCNRQYISARIKAQEIPRPLHRKMVRHHKQALTAKPQTPALHCRRHHLKGFPCTHTMGKQRIFPINLMRHRICLIRLQMVFRRHLRKCQVGTVIFPRPDRVK